MELGDRLAGRRAQARRVLWIERVWPALWPAIAIVGAWVAVALFDVPSLLPTWWHLIVLAALATAIGGATWHGLRRVQRPTDAEVDRRLELASGVKHRPLVVLEDRPATVDPATARLWTAHKERAAAQVAQLRAGWPHPGIPQRDVRATRAALAVVLVAGLVVAGAEAPGRVLRSVWPGLPEGTAAPAPQLQVWLTPPTYTGCRADLSASRGADGAGPGRLPLDREPDGWRDSAHHELWRPGNRVRDA